VGFVLEKKLPVDEPTPQTLFCVRMEKILSTLVTHLSDLGIGGLLIVAALLAVYWQFHIVRTARASLAKLASVDQSSLHPDMVVLLNNAIKSCAPNASGVTIFTNNCLFLGQAHVHHIDVLNALALWLFVFQSASTKINIIMRVMISTYLMFPAWFGVQQLFANSLKIFVLIVAITCNIIIFSREPEARHSN
jgi:hypothetical protein